MEDRVLQLRDCVHEQQEALAFLENNKGGEDWTDTDNKTYANMEQKIASLNNGIGRLELTRKLKEGLTAPANSAVKAILNNPNATVKSLRQLKDGSG